MFTTCAQSLVDATFAFERNIAWHPVSLPDPEWKSNKKCKTKDQK